MRNTHTDQPTQQPTRPLGNGTNHRWSVTIAHVAGIDVRLHASFALIVLLFAGSGSDAAAALSNLMWLGIIFSCVLVHELAHSLLARRRGAEVHAIMLLPIGGVSELDHLPEAPRDELEVAVVGPLASYGIAVFALIAVVATGQSLLPFDLIGGSLLHRLVWFNLAVGTFNLLPAFPMDGGRVLRALLELRHDRVWATRRAAAIGRWLGGFMAALGLFVDLWLVLIGLFIAFGATAEEAATIAHVRLAGRHVGQAMLLDPMVLDAATPVDELRERIRRTPQTTFPVLDADRYIGIVTLDQVSDAPAGTPTRALVRSSVAALDPEDDLAEVFDMFLRERQRTTHPVLDNGRVVGLLRPEDITRGVGHAVARN